MLKFFPEAPTYITIMTIVSHGTTFVNNRNVPLILVVVNKYLKFSENVDTIAHNIFR